MGSHCRVVTILKEVNKTEAAVASFTYGFVRRVDGFLRWLAYGTRRLPFFHRLRKHFRDVRHTVFGYKALPYIAKINGKPFLHINVEEEEACLMLSGLGASHIFEIKPVYDLGMGKYLTAWSYYDGGSDGREEARQFHERLQHYFHQQSQSKEL